MPDEKKIADEVLSENELDNIAGGTREETLADGAELHKRGLLTEKEAAHATHVYYTLYKMGYTGYKDNGGSTANVYTDKNGNVITREEFWKNFNAENGINPEGGSRIL